MAIYTGAGTARLTDGAVAQAAASQQAGNGDASSPEAQPNLAFWMNARQQRAEMVLDRDGQAVRVQVMLEGNAAHISFRSDEQATRSMLDASMAQLREMLAAQGVELAGVDVDAQSAGGEGSGATAERGFAAQGSRQVLLRAEDLLQANMAPAQMRALDTGRGLDIYA